MFGNLYKERETKFFIVKSANRENLELAFEHKVWATTTLNETRWNEAFMVFMINISIVYYTSYSQVVTASLKVSCLVT